MGEDGERLARVVAYHDGTKHHVHRFARSSGFLDWASQPHPFRSFAGAIDYPLPPRPDAASAPAGDSRLTAALVGDVLRHSLGLSAWKSFRDSKWSLRVNPSSGNLHPTEAYVIAGPLAGAAVTPAVYHYAADRHALEQRAVLDADAWASACDGDSSRWLVALTSIHWRESWKYGERAFRYCQHDLGHAIAAIRFAAAIAGCEARLLPEWSSADIATLTGIDRDDDYVEAEREEAGCVMVVGRRSAGSGPRSWGVSPSLIAGGSSRWTGRASQLSEDHVRWTFIDDVAEATRDDGRHAADVVPAANDAGSVPDRALVLQRRSAVAFDGRSTIDAATFLSMLARVMPTAAAPWDALWWSARIHLAIFVHRVTGLDPGLYVLARDPAAVDRLRTACGREFLWERTLDALPLLALARGDCRALARRLSCDQEIASDGFFSLGMIADFDASLAEFGPSFYRHLFWEAGIVGQVLYLEAEAAGARGTGIGCFYDDPVHETLGLSSHAFQSLYHFSIGAPVEDDRLTTGRGYSWE
jgi:SagB-type dehydrogenase family enzyme